MSRLPVPLRLKEASPCFSLSASLSAFGNGSGSGSERRIQAKTKIRGSTWESPSASAAVVTGSSDSYEKRDGRKDERFL